MVHCKPAAQHLGFCQSKAATADSMAGKMLTVIKQDYSNRSG
jgi:hypothetical protein